MTFEKYDMTVEPWKIVMTSDEGGFRNQERERALG